MPLLTHKIISRRTSSAIRTIKCNYKYTELEIKYFLSHIQLFVTLWTVAHQASQSTGFLRQEYWSGLPHPPLRDIPDPGFEPMSPVSSALQADSSPRVIGEAPINYALIYALINAYMWNLKKIV